jgi:dolichol-phosphate mannosyltransferase
MTYREKTFVSAVVYLSNDRRNAAEFIKTVAGQLEEAFENYEIVAVDDCSFDGTGEAVREAAEGVSGAVSVVRLSFPQGTQLAMNAGVDLAIGDFVYEFESCFVDFDPEILNAAYKAALEGSDIVSVSPSGRQRLTSGLFYRIFNKNSGVQYPLASDRFRLVSRRAINRIHAMSDTIVYRKAFYMGCGLKTAFMKYDPAIKARQKGDYRQRQTLAVDSLIHFTGVFYKVTFLMSALMMAIAVLGGAYAMTIYILGSPIEGWTTSILFIALGFFGMFAILTVILKYLSVLLGLVFKKQGYTVESVTKL